MLRRVLRCLLVGLRPHLGDAVGRGGLAPPERIRDGGSFTTPLPTGFYGLVLSPGKGLFAYNPFLLLAIPGAVALWRRDRAATALLVWLMVDRVLLYSRWSDWAGGVSWGPRFLMPAVGPFALLAVYGVSRIPRLRPALRVPAVAAVAALVVAGGVVSVASVWVSYGSSERWVTEVPSQEAARRHAYVHTFGGSAIAYNLRHLDGDVRPWTLVHFRGGPDPIGHRGHRHLLGLLHVHQHDHADVEERRHRGGQQRDLFAAIAFEPEGSGAAGRMIAAMRFRLDDQRPALAADLGADHHQAQQKSRTGAPYHRHAFCRRAKRKALCGGHFDERARRRGERGARGGADDGALFQSIDGNRADEAILATVKKTNRVLIVHEDTVTGGIAGEITARINELAFEWLDAPVRRVAAHDVPLPYAPQLEDFVLPQTPDIVRAARWLAAY